MHQSKNLRKIALAILLTTLAGACALTPVPHRGTASLSTYPATSEPQTPEPEAKEISQAAGHNRPQAPGFVVHVDPLTGQMLPEPPTPAQGAVLESQQLHSTPIEAPQAVEIPSAVSGGGVKVKLNRQFHQPLFATIEAGGKIKLEHGPAHSESGVK